MACDLFGAKGLIELMLTYCQLDSWEKNPWNMDQNATIVTQENRFENFWNWNDVGNIK